MHELSVTESLLDLALSHAKQAQAAKVTGLNLVIGRLSSIVDDSVQFYWDIIAENTICQGAILNFDRRPAVLHCADCSTDFTIEKELTPCPSCGGFHTTIVSGEEFYLDSIEIEKETENIQ
jgi:hydrogenase nickel incorporation protein HypA/HybF